MVCIIKRVQYISTIVVFFFIRPTMHDIIVLQRHDYNGSSSDDNRSSGHASMSDGHTSSSPPVDRHHHYRSPLNSVPEDERY